MQTIMIVEDDPKIAKHLQDYIEKYGYRVSFITDFERVMEVFQEENRLSASGY